MIKIYIAFWLFLFGTVFGSFLNCAAMRIVRGEDFIRGRSRCRSCGHELRAMDLIPIVSWLLSHGRCRYCKAKLSLRYPLTELVFAVALEGLFFRYGITVAFAGASCLTGCLFVLSLVDLEILEIPDGCLLAGVIAFCVTAPFTMESAKAFFLHVAAGLVTGVVMLVLSLVMDGVLQRESMGGGDIKLFALLGLWFGFTGILILTFLSCIFGLLFVSVRRRQTEPGGIFPFGPAIAAAAYVMLIFGDGLRDWYFRFL